jgi:hypothetical protein
MILAKSGGGQMGGAARSGFTVAPARNNAKAIINANRIKKWMLFAIIYP